MISLWTLMALVHLVGLALGLGAATVKTALVLKFNQEESFAPVYVRVTKPVTRFIVLGIVLMTLSGIVWMVLGYPFRTLLIVKHVLVGMMWVLGAVIDNVVEPKVVRLAPPPGEPAGPEFTRIRKRHLALEIIATALFYVITFMGVAV